MNGWTWTINPDRLRRCPISGGKPSNFRVPNEAPHLGWCWSPPPVAPYGWKATKNPHLFINESKVSETFVSPVIKAERPDKALASSTLRDSVYRSLLRSLSLNGAHKKDLSKRGFDPESLQRIPFASLRSGPKTSLVRDLSDKYGEHHLEGVPGFYINQSPRSGQEYWTLSGRAGLLIPVQDIEKRIIGLQIRPDSNHNLSSKKQPKYVWMSSKNRKGGRSIGSPAGVLFPKGQNKTKHAKRVWFTEGFFKALAITERFQEPVVWIAGVHQWKNALEPLSQLDPEEVVVAFDMDLFQNAHVQGALLQSIHTIGSTLSVHVRSVQWDPALGKGIDDAILSGRFSEKSLKPLEWDQLLTQVRPPRQLPRNPFLRLNEAEALKPPFDTALPPREECWGKTEQAVKKALSDQVGTITLITAGTGYGKSTALVKHVSERTLIVSRDYDSSGQQIREALSQSGKESQWIYGKQKPLEQLVQDATAHQRERSQKAHCKDFMRAIQATAAGHNPCTGCSHAPVDHPQEPGEIWYGCGYRQHQDEIREAPPRIGLAVPLVATRSDILKDYDTLVFDDIPNLLQHLSDQRTLDIQDIARWQDNRFGEMPPLVLDFFADLRQALSLSGLAPQKPSTELRGSARSALHALKQWKDAPSPLPCESPTHEHGRIVYPKVWVKDLITALATGLPVDLTVDRIVFWTGRPELLSLFKEKRVIILDATPDLLVWKALFGKTLHYQLKIPKLPLSRPRIVQVPDILGLKKQIQGLEVYIRQLAERENAFIITRAGDCATKLHADGWLGRHERALNSLQDYSAGILAGHFSLPADAAWKMAQGIRTLAHQLNVPEPITHIFDRDEDGRVWRTYYDRSQRYAGLQRRTHLHEDPLTAHIGMHFHTSAVIQTWGRGRGDKLLYLLDGMPLYNPEGHIWVTLLTLEELGLSPPERRGNPVIEESNQRATKHFLLKVDKGVEIMKAWVLLHEELPSERSLIRKLNERYSRSARKRAKAILERLSILLEAHLQQKQHDRKVLQGAPLNSDQYLTELGGAPSDHYSKPPENEDFPPDSMHTSMEALKPSLSSTSLSSQNLEISSLTSASHEVFSSYETPLYGSSSADWVYQRDSSSEGESDG